jgi:hypothetical protein
VIQLNMAGTVAARRLEGKRRAILAP